MKLPTQLTVLRIALAAVFFVLFAVLSPPLVGWATIVFLIAAATDWWDGHFARKMGLVTPLGAFLDPLADKLLTGTALVAFALTFSFIPMWEVLIIIARDVYLTLLRMAADSMGLAFKTSVLAKIKTFAQMVFILLILTWRIIFKLAVLRHWITLGDFFAIFIYLGVLFDLVVLLTIVSGVQYTYRNWPFVRLVFYRYVLHRPQQESI